DRHRKDQDRDRLQEHSEQEQEKVQKQKDRELVLRDRKDQLGNPGRNLLEREDEGHDGGHGGDEQDCRRDDRGYHQRMPDPLHSEVAIGEPDNEGVGDGDGGGFGRREDAGLYADNDDDRQEQRRQRPHNVSPAFGPRYALR